MIAPQINHSLSTDETLCFNVPSETTSETYLTSYDVLSRWLCDCPDYYYRKRFCKHMKACAELTGISDATVYHDVKNTREAGYL